MRICIDNTDVEYNLTIGKEYKGHDDDGQLVNIIDDTGFMETYVVGRFEKREGEKHWKKDNISILQGS
jgi:hypothetical protein